MMEIINRKGPSDNWFTSNKSESICRACLNLGSQLQNLHQGGFGLQFSYCTSLQISEYDGLPAWLCQPCCNILENFYSFKQLCCRSDAIIKEGFNFLKPYHKPIKLETVMPHSHTHKNNLIQNTAENVDHFSKDNQAFYESCADDLLTSIHSTADQYDMANSDNTNDRDVIDKQVKKKKSHLFSKKIFKCSYCAKSFKSASRLKNHSDIHNKIISKSNILNSLPKKCNKIALEKKIKNQLTCSSCNQRFFKYHKLEAHMRGHFGITVEGVSCKLCTKKLKNYESLRVHMITHSGEKKYTCSTCSKTFAHKCALKVHERIHSGIKKYVCHICGDKFVQDANLKIHLLRHSGEKPHACDRCDKRFTQTGDLKRHMMRHEGVKNYPCSACDLKFFSKQEQSKHSLSHSGAKPFACDICGKSFKTQSFIAVHRRTHTGERPFQCEFCKQKFMAGKDLRNHRMIHTGEKPHKCQLCPQAFIQKSALNRHIKCHNKYQSVHGRESIEPDIRLLPATPIVKTDHSNDNTAIKETNMF